MQYKVNVGTQIGILSIECLKTGLKIDFVGLDGKTLSGTMSLNTLKKLTSSVGLGFHCSSAKKYIDLINDKPEAWPFVHVWFTFSKHLYCIITNKGLTIVNTRKRTYRVIGTPEVIGFLAWPNPPPQVSMLVAKRKSQDRRSQNSRQRPSQRSRR